MKVVFRVDASLQIGSGHVMRCLTLAKALKGIGAECQFICREHLGNLVGYIRNQGFRVYELPVVNGEINNKILAKDDLPIHAHWLGVTWEQDAEECESILNQIQPNWLVVDHYGIDALWETRLSTGYRKLFVIDDLLDRHHQCDVLLDQNLGRSTNDYLGLVPPHCHILAGARYALLRSEFAEWRDKSLQRRVEPRLRRILITMGGVDRPNATGMVLETLRRCPLPSDCQITVVMGANAPWLSVVRSIAASIPWSTEVLVNINDMAQRMTQSDLAIGAAGSTSWERCCLGLPTLMITLAQNQIGGARALQDAGAALLVGDVTDIENNLGRIIEISMSGLALKKMSDAASAVCDGEGVTCVVNYLRQVDD